MTRASRLWLGIGIPALALGGLTITAALESAHDSNRVLAAVVGPLFLWGFVFCGLVAWTRRPDNATGRLLVFVGATSLAWTMSESDNDYLFTIGNVVGSLALAAFAHLLLAFPRGRLRGTERRFVALIYPTAFLSGLVPAFFDPRLDTGCKTNCPRNVFLISNSHLGRTVVGAFFVTLAVLIFASVGVILFRRWLRATPAARRLVSPVYLFGAVAVLLFAIGQGAQGLSSSVGNVFSSIAFICFLILPFFFLTGLIRTRFSRAAAQLLLQTPDEPTPEEAQTGLRRVLGDPSLRLLLWHEQAHCYVDVDGNPTQLRGDARGRATTKVEYEGRPLAALVHDRALLDEPEWLEEVVAVARLGFEKDRGTQALRRSEARSRALLNALPDLMIRTNRAGEYLDVAGDETGLVRPAEEMIGLTIFDTLPSELAERMIAAVRRSLDTGETHAVEYELEVEGEVRHFEARMVPSGDNELISIVRDFTDRRRLEGELQKRLQEIEREQEFTRTVVNTSPIVVILVDPEGRIIRFNNTTESLFEYPDDERVRGRQFWDVFVVEEDREAARTILARLAAGEPQVGQELRWRSSKGEVLTVATSSSPILDGQGRFRFLVCGLDVTERKRNLEELRASRARIVEAADGERRKLERNLHDGAQQRLVSLSLALRLAQSRLTTDPAAAGEILSGAGRELALALEELRELARGLHPAVLADRGLSAALETLADRAPVPTDLDAALDERLPAPVEVAAFYVVSEALTNVAKYAQASSASIRVARDNGMAVVEVVDDGVGGADDSRGSGLRGLHDRVEALDGILEVASPLGGGTQVRAIFPLPRQGS